MIQPDGSAPYAPPQAVLDVVSRYRDHGLTVPFNTDVLERAGVTPSLSPRTLQSLKLLDLIDESGHPTPNLDVLERARSEEFQDRLRELITRVYADVLAFADPESDTIERVEDAFRTYRPKGQRGRMVTLFLGLCTAAGMKTPGQRQRTTDERPPRRAPLSGSTKPATTRAKANLTVTKAPHHGMPPAVQGLLDSLPDPDVGWTREERDLFLATFAAVLDFAYPVRRRADLAPTNIDKEDSS